MPRIPDKNVNFMVYSESNILYGVAEVTLPDFESMSESMSGAGIVLARLKFQLLGILVLCP